MKSAVVVSILLLTLFVLTQTAFSWDCSIEMDGPTWVKIGRSIELTASGLPEGGQYSWSSLPELVPNGATATLTGFQPDFSEYIRVIVRYTTNKGNSCSDIKWVYAHACEARINGTEKALIGEAVNLTAETDCGDGGTFSWSGAPGLFADGATAVFTPEAEGEYDIEAAYNLPDGGVAKATHQILVKGCTVSIAGPAEMDLGGKLSIVAEGTPAGGTYQWSSNLDLQPQENIVEVSGSTAGEFPVDVTYTMSDVGATTCEESHMVRVRNCELRLESLLSAVGVSPFPDSYSVAAVGAPTLCSATGLPVDGSISWLSPEGLLDQGMTAQYTAQEPGLKRFEAEYTTPEGEVCSDSFDTTFVKVGSLTSPYVCVNSGTTLEKSSFFVTSDPPGYLNANSGILTISPLTLSTFSSTSEKTITASISQESILDDAYTTIIVVNKDNREGVSLNLNIPNYVNDTLKFIGVGEQLDLSLSLELSRYNECCSSSTVKKSVDGSTNISLSADAGPYTIIGIPLPESIKNSVTLDALAVKVTGDLKGTVSADYDGCQESTEYSGTAGLNAGVEVGGEVKAKTPGEIIVIKGTLKGSTGVKETISFESSKMVLAGSWDGLTVAGEVYIRFVNMFKMKPVKVSHVILEKMDFPVASFDMPSLK